MGIDIYMYWKDQTDEEKKAQFTGFSVASGHVGYLREAYHGGPYATRVLMPEAFAACEEDVGDGPGQCPKAWFYQFPDGADPSDSYPCARIPVDVLKGRLEAAVEAAATRERVIYKDKPSQTKPGPVKSLIDFVALYEKLDTEGREPAIFASF